MTRGGDARSDDAFRACFRHRAQPAVPGERVSAVDAGAAAVSAPLLGVDSWRVGGWEENGWFG